MLLFQDAISYRDPVPTFELTWQGYALLGGVVLIIIIVALMLTTNKSKQG